jgi:hypothetical protein
MVDHKVIITSPARVFQLGIPGYTNPRFPIDDVTSLAQSSDHDSSDDSEDDDTFPPDSSSSGPSAIQSSPAHLSDDAPILLAPIVAPFPVVPSLPVSTPPIPVLITRIAPSVNDDVVEVLPTTPLTQATQRDQLRQNVRSVLYEDGHLPLAPRYESRQHDNHDNQSQVYPSQHHYRDPTRDRDSYHRTSDRNSHRSSVSTQEMEMGLEDYDPKTLPNTIQESIRWTGTNYKSYEHYLSEPCGRLSNHHLVRNALDISSQSTLYSDIMILTHPAFILEC